MQMACSWLDIECHPDAPEGVGDDPSGVAGGRDGLRIKCAGHCVAADAILCSMSSRGYAYTRFNDLVGELDYPMFIVTARATDGERAGCLVGFVTQCSIKPPRVLVCLSKVNRTYRVAQSAELLAVHFVPAAATQLADLFGGSTGDDCDKFAACAWEDGPAGVPILEECRNWFTGRVLERLDLGDHCGFVLDPIEVSDEIPQAEFTFHRARRIEPGHEA